MVNKSAKSPQSKKAYLAEKGSSLLPPLITHNSLRIGNRRQLTSFSPTQTHTQNTDNNDTHTHTHTHTYVYMCVCMCVRAWLITRQNAGDWGERRVWAGWGGRRWVVRKIEMRLDRDKVEENWGRGCRRCNEMVIDRRTHTHTHTHAHRCYTVSFRASY